MFISITIIIIYCNTYTKIKLTAQSLNIFLYFASSAATVEIAILIPTYNKIPKSIITEMFLIVTYHNETELCKLVIKPSPESFALKKLIVVIGNLLNIISAGVKSTVKPAPPPVLTIPDNKNLITIKITNTTAFIAYVKIPATPSTTPLAPPQVPSSSPI